eukprot:1199868-Pleurochrysis_carterae.AAC.4
MLERRKTRRGAGGPKDCKCGKGVRGARREGHQRGQKAKTGSGGELVLKGQSTPAPGTPSPPTPRGGSTSFESALFTATIVKKVYEYDICRHQKEHINITPGSSA